MRIFIHNVDTFHGKVLVDELRKLDGQNNRIFGTAAHNADDAPKAVKRILSREDPKRAKKMTETIQSCGLVVIDLFNCTLDDLHFAISALKVDPRTLKPTGELEKEVIFVVVSSVMVWANTKLSREGPVTDSDYLQRMPVAGTRYELWKEYENLVLNCFNREGSTVKGFVVAGGTLYGQGEDTLYPLFKDAWRGVQERTIIAPGTNLLPTVHVRDLSRLVRHLAFSGAEINATETPFFIAVDQPPCPPGEEPPPPPVQETPEGEEEPAEIVAPVRFSKPSTQAQIVQGIVDEFCDHYDVPVVAPSAGRAAETDDLQMLQEKLTLDLWIQPSSVMMDPAFAEQCSPPGWWSKDGLAANMRTIADEFCKERKLRAMRVVIAGPPASGKSSLARAVADHFKIPHMEIDSQNISDMATRLSSTVCRYRGYVLEAGCLGFEEVERLFREDYEVPPDPDADPPAELEEGEEAAPKQMERRLNEDICPAFVIITQAPMALCRARWQSRNTGTPQEFESLMAQYTTSNLTEENSSLADFFQDIAKIGVLNLPIAGKDEEDMFESTRIYMEKSGRPFNYLPLEHEVAGEIIAKRAAREDADDRDAAAQAQRLRAESAGEQKEMQCHAQRLRMIAEHERKRKELEEMPLREYLMRYMVPSLTEGLIEVCKVVPDNPTAYLANYLEQHAADANPI